MSLTLEQPDSERPAQTKGKRCIVVSLKGGLGNQMFQYAHGFSLAHLLDASLMLTHPGKRRTFALDLFGLHCDKELPAGDAIHYDASYRPGIERRILEDASAASSEVVWLHGYFQNERFFLPVENQIRRRFALPHRSIPQCGGKTPVCVHVRRGDFVNHPVHHVCSVNYYNSAMHFMRGKVADPIFMVVSDDPAWCKANLLLLADVHVLGRQSVREALEIMYACSAFIISNSTFGWWPAWMSNSPHIVWPDRFVNRGVWDIGPERWIRIAGDGLPAPDTPQSSTESRGG